MWLLTLCRVLEASLVEISLRAEDAALFLDEADSVSVVVLGVWCCIWLGQMEEGMDAALGLSGRGQWSRRRASRQRSSQLEF